MTPQHRPECQNQRCYCFEDDGEGYSLPTLREQVEQRFSQIDHALTKEYWGLAWDRPDIRKQVIVEILTSFALAQRREQMAQIIEIVRNLTVGGSYVDEDGRMRDAIEQTAEE